MTTFSASGTKIDSGTVDASNQLLASIGAGTYLASVDVQGYINLPNNNSNPAPPVVPFYDVQAGLQWVPSGNAPTNLLSGNTNVGNWLSFARSIPSSLANITYPVGTTNDIQQIGFPLALHWRGLFVAPQNIDLYFSVGSSSGFTSQTFFEAMYSWLAQYASFP